MKVMINSRFDKIKIILWRNRRRISLNQHSSIMGDLDITVTTAIKEIHFRFLAKRSAHKLFQEVCRNLSIREVWYFGLYYFNPQGEKFWIDQSNKRMSVCALATKKLYFGIKYYPEDFTTDIIEAITRKYFYFEIQNNILNNRLYCPADTCVLLASYAVHFKYGDFDESVDISGDQLIPDRVVNQHKPNKADFLQSVKHMWSKHIGLLPDDTVSEYLKLAQNLDMIGVHYYDIKYGIRRKLVLGITPQGINIYNPNDKMNPLTQFQWAEIDHLDPSGRSIMITMLDEKAQNVLIFCANQTISKELVKLGVGYHQLYIRRRKPDALNVQEMRKSLDTQRDRLKRHQLKSKRLEDDYQEKMKKMHSDLDSTRNQLNDSLLTNHKLQKCLAQLGAAKKDLEKRQRELEKMLRRLKTASNLEDSEHFEEIFAKRVQVLRMQEQVQSKDEKAQRLQDKMEEAKRQYKFFQVRQIAEHEQEFVIRRCAHEEYLCTFHETHSERNELPELAEINQQLRDELKLLQAKLEESRDNNMDTPEDRIHRENRKQGRDKYKTLSAIRRGNTNRRVAMMR